MKNLVPFFLLIIALSACNNGDVLYENEAVGYTQGTTFQVKYLSSKPQNFKADIDSIFLNIDQSMSTYKANSLISKVNRGVSGLSLDPSFRAVLARSLEIAEETDGFFDPSVGPLVKLWGFDQTKPNLREIQPQVDSILGLVGYDKIKLIGNAVTMPKGYQIDFNAIAQGYTVDLVAKFLSSKGIENYMVEVGGEIKTLGTNNSGKSWIIGIDKPTEDIDLQNRFQVILSLNNRALATSGNYRKFWTDSETGIRYAHTIDPHQGIPARNTLLSVSILAKSCMDADAYATACMAMGEQRAWDFISANPKLDAYLVSADSKGGWKVRMTDGFRTRIKEDPSSK